MENPLCGLTGATYVYGAQKGIPDELMNKIDRDMEHMHKSRQDISVKIFQSSGVREQLED